MAKGDDKIDKQFAALLGMAGASANGNKAAASLFANSPYAQRTAFLGLGQTTPGSIPYGPYAPGQPVGVPYDKAVLMPAQWDDETMRNFVNKGIINKVPGFEPGMGLPQIQSAWQNMVEASIMFNQSGNNKKTKNPWTPWDVLETWSDQKGKFGTRREGDWVYDVATGERLKYVGPTKKTVTDKRVDLSNPEDVKAIATQALRELLGRAPTGKELAQFRSSINAEERANPTVTTTTQTLSPDIASGTVDVVASDTTTSGGVSDAARAALVSTPTMETKEYGKYQSATTYWDAMMQMLAGGS